MPELREYLGTESRSNFGHWFSGLDNTAAAKVVTALSRVEMGNTSSVKAVGEGVCEVKIDFGPDYRVYFGWDGPQLVILLGGGTKKRQDRDIAVARWRWRDYKARKAMEHTCP